MALRVPPSLAANCGKTPERAAWLARLPEMLQELQCRWSLVPGYPFASEAGWVAPVTLAEGTAAVLKICMPHMEGEHEIQGLRFWNGNSTVRLLESDEEASAMLIERCEPGATLRALPESVQDVVIARLLKTLWREPSPTHVFRSLSTMTQHWSDETLADIEQWTDPGLVREGLRLFQDLPRSAPTEMLLATDLHAGNVLRAEREPWLVIDPKPFVGDPAYDATQHLMNCRERMLSNPDETIRRFADLLEVDRERVRLWMFARAAAEPRDDWGNSDLLKIALALAP